VSGTSGVNQPAVGRLRRGAALINFSASVVTLALPTYTAYGATTGIR
jgi:3-oxoacyl-[acyl-carrier protein] reductase